MKEVLNNLKIAILTRFLEYPGGVESVSYLLKFALEMQGHQVTIIAADQACLNLKDKMRGFFLGDPSESSRFLQGQISDYDVVICNGEFGYGIVHPKCVTLYHGSAYGYRKAVSKYLGPRSSLRLRRLEFLQKKAAQGKITVCVSNYLKEILQASGVEVDHIIENGIDLTLFRKKNIQKTGEYLFVGSHDFLGKGFDVLQALARKGLQVDCVTSNKPCSELGWIPQVAHHQMPEIYSRYRAMIFPSRFEGMSIAPIEAMACGLPVVISPVGLGPKLKQVIPEFVAESFTPEEYYQKLMHIEEKYDEFSEKAIEYVKLNHSLECFSRNWNALLRSL